MIGATTIFFAPDWPRRCRVAAADLDHRHGTTDRRRHAGAASPSHDATSGARDRGAVAWIVVQVLLPLRHLLYPGDARWTAEGYRFVVERAAHREERRRDLRGDRPGHRPLHAPPRAPSLFTDRQIQMMATDPELIRQAAHMIADDRRRSGPPGSPRVEVRAERVPVARRPTGGAPDRPDGRPGRRAVPHRSPAVGPVGARRSPLRGLHPPPPGGVAAYTRPPDASGGRSMSDLVEQLVDVVGAPHVSSGADVSDDYSHDEALTVDAGAPGAVVRPATTDEVAAVLAPGRRARRPGHGPRAAAPACRARASRAPDGIVVSFERMDADPRDRHREPRRRRAAGRHPRPARRGHRAARPRLPGVPGRVQRQPRRQRRHQRRRHARGEVRRDPPPGARPRGRARAPARSSAPAASS